LPNLHNSSANAVEDRIGESACSPKLHVNTLIAVSLTRNDCVLVAQISTACGDFAGLTGAYAPS
jgi:hypothetical protein